MEGTLKDMEAYIIEYSEFISQGGMIELPADNSNESLYYFLNSVSRLLGGTNILNLKFLRTMVYDMIFNSGETKSTGVYVHPPIDTIYLRENQEYIKMMNVGVHEVCERTLCLQWKVRNHDLALKIQRIVIEKLDRDHPDEQILSRLSQDKG